MAFQQLYYTSCEHGLAGYAGYQFNAITPGVPAAVLREVEERTLYEPPRWRMTDLGADEPEAYPIAFSYGVSETTGTTITAHVVFSGVDYSGRSGNYFVHALVSSAPQQDFGVLLSGSIPRLRAFDEIVDVRAGADRSPRVDGTLLRLLWPGGCPPEHLTELLGILTDSPGPGIVDWFAGEVRAIATHRTTADDWVRLAEALSEHPILAMLPEDETRPVHCAMRVLPLLRRAYLAGPPGDADVFSRLFAEYAEADDNTRRLLERDLPPLLAQASPLASALRGCPGEVAVAFGHKLAERLAPLHPDVALAARVFAAQASRPTPIGEQAENQ